MNHLFLFLKKILNYLLYIGTALLACLFSLLLVLNFLNPVFSRPKELSIETRDFKKIFKDIVRELKATFSEVVQKDTGSDQADQPDQKGAQSPAPPPPTRFEKLEEVETKPVEGVKQESPSGKAGKALPVEKISEEDIPPVQDIPPAGSPPPTTETLGVPSPTEGPSAKAPSDPNTATNQKQGSVTQGGSSELSLQIQSDMSSFIYEPRDKKDPFEDPAVAGEFVDGRKIPILPKTPPESYDLKEIRLKGIIWDTQNPKALFQLPGDEGYYTLVKGDKIGRSNGIVFEIRESEVVIVEVQTLGRAEEKQEKTVIKIKKIDRLGLAN